MDLYLESEGEESKNLMIIFVAMKRTAWRLASKLTTAGYLVESLHGDKSQQVYFFIL